MRNLMKLFQEIANIDLPNIIKDKKACINFEHDDENCFIYSVRYAIDNYNKLEYKHPERVKRYKKHINDKIFSDFEFPMKLDDITRFENKSLKKIEGYPSMSIIVYSLERSKDIKEIPKINDDGELYFEKMYYYTILPLRISQKTLI